MSKLKVTIDYIKLAQLLKGVKHLITRVEEELDDAVKTDEEIQRIRKLNEDTHNPDF